MHKVVFALGDNPEHQNLAGYNPKEEVVPHLAKTGMSSWTGYNHLWYLFQWRSKGGGGNRERDEGGLFTLAKQDAVNTSNAFSNNQKMELILHKELECAAQPHDVGGHTAKDKHKFKLPAHE